MSSRPAKAGMALLLTLAAGCVDITGFLALYHVFAAHMTGAKVHLGQSAMEARWGDALHSVAVVAAFLAGSVAGRVVIECGARKGLRSIASANLLLEGVLIAAVIAFSSSARSLAWPMMLASAMGVQTATLTRVGPLTVHTTFVTGMLNKLAQLLSHGVFVSYDRRHGQKTEAVPKQVFGQAGFIFMVWSMYVAGAAAGTWLQFRWHMRALLLPLGVIALAIALDQVVPLSIEEEHEQMEPGRKLRVADKHYRRAG